MNVIKISPLILAQPAGDTQTARRRAFRLMQQAECLGHDVEALLRTDAGKVTDGERLFIACRPRSAVAGQVQPGVNDVDALARNGEISRHEVGTVPAGGDEAVELLAMFANQFQTSLAERFGESFQIDV